MPAFNLSQGAQTVVRYDTVFQCSPDGLGFVTHVALHDADRTALDDGDECAVVHMGPPLEQNGRLNACATGQVPLTVDEIKEVGSWISEIVEEYTNLRIEGWRQYVAHPPWRDEIDVNTEIRRYRRYSCAGFVLDAHHQVGIDLLNVEEASLPPVDEDTLALAYGKPFRRARTKFGLPGDGPWRVVLAGYVLQSLNRRTDEIRSKPYQAMPGDERTRSESV